MNTPELDHATNCPAWCEGCERASGSDTGEGLRAHRRQPLHVTSVTSRPIVAVALGRVDDIDNDLRGETTIALQPGEGEPPRIISAEQARALSDALDYASRTAASDNDATCADCRRPWPAQGLHDGRCAQCHRTHVRPRLVGAPEPAPTPLRYQAPTEEGDWLTQAQILKRYGNRSTCVEVMRYPATGPNDSASDLIRLRLLGHGYLTAGGARLLADELTAAAELLYTICNRQSPAM